MTRITLSMLAFFVAIPAMAADLAPITSLVGRYPVLEWNGDARAAGVIEIVNDGRGVGYTMQPLDLASHPVKAMSVLAPIGTTTITRQGNAVVQESLIGDTRLHIDYLMYAGYVEINSVYCPKAWPRCENTHIGVTSGKASGEHLDFKSFVAQVQGSYRIDLVGGKKPHDLDNTADVSPDTDEASFTMPFCPPGSSSCDPGYLSFNWTKTEIFHRTLGPQNELYSILVRDGAKLSYFSWETNAGTVTFRNFQYRLKGGVMLALEHVMKKI